MFSKFESYWIFFFVRLLSIACSFLCYLFPFQIVTPKTGVSNFFQPPFYFPFSIFEPISSMCFSILACAVVAEHRTAQPVTGVQFPSADELLYLAGRPAEDAGGRVLASVSTRPVGGGARFVS